MGYKIKDACLRKITGTVVCEFGDECREFENGAILAEAAFDKPYEVAGIKALGNKIVVSLNPMNSRTGSGSLSWIGEAAVPQYDRDKEWVKAYIEHFGEEPSFF